MFHQCHVTAILQSDWPRSIFNMGTRKCDPFDQTLSQFLGGTGTGDYNCPSYGTQHTSNLIVYHYYSQKIILCIAETICGIYFHQVCLSSM